MSPSPRLVYKPVSNRKLLYFVSIIKNSKNEKHSKSHNNYREKDESYAVVCPEPYIASQGEVLPGNEVWKILLIMDLSRCGRKVVI